MSTKNDCGGTGVVSTDWHGLAIVKAGAYVTNFGSLPSQPGVIKFVTDDGVIFFLDKGLVDLHIRDGVRCASTEKRPDSREWVVGTLVRSKYSGQQMVVAKLPNRRDQYMTLSSTNGLVSEQHWYDDVDEIYSFESDPAAGVVTTDLYRFLDAAAGEGLICGDVDAGDLFIRLFPGEYKAASAEPAKGE